ncbi:hypothetical protein BN946_scf184499.g28 [Trametes cinnabarina]|uniref:Checkpoint protein n=1 Tax=Pycnoporus cinnabarinus TaxID=5643 RepID=A0A060S7Y2_PYCCI|nr:hypothetical protein BN946_scf184499.g28 [Trametes cinnabarina]
MRAITYSRGCDSTRLARCEKKGIVEVVAVPLRSPLANRPAMRFRATIENVDTFAKIVQSVEKLQKRCIIRFGEHEMRIICTGDVNEGGIQVWSLAKKGEKSVLSFEITGLTATGRNISVVQHILIDVLRHSEVERLKEPMCPEPDVHILLPPLGKLRTVVERLRPLAGEGVIFRANLSGELQLAVNTDNARVEVGWSGLANPAMSCGDKAKVASQGEDDSDAKDPTQMHGVLVSHKCLLKFLNSHVISSTTIACNVADAGGVLTYYIPAKFDDGM